jgi:hypothetical protein
MMFAHWFKSRGRSRHESIHLPKKWPMIVSDVGRMTYGSSSSLRSSSFPSTALRPVCVTTATSMAKPFTCAASLARKESGISSGKYAFWCPVALKRASRYAWIFSQIAKPCGRITMQPLTTPAGSASSAAWITSWYH